MEILCLSVCLSVCDRKVTLNTKLRLFPLRYEVRHQRAAHGRAACQRRFDCMKQRILTERKVSPGHSHLPTCCCLTQRSAQHSISQVKRRVFPPSLLKLQQKLTNKDLFICHQLNTMQHSS